MLEGPDIVNVPVFITHRDRSKMLERCVHSLLRAGFRRLIVVDTGSENPPHRCNLFDVIRTDNEFKHLTVWEKGFAPDNDYYVVTEDDIMISPHSPANVPQHLRDLLVSYDGITKIGLRIATNVVAPSRYAESLDHEMALNDSPNNGINLLFAPVDTHFAMHRPGSGWEGISGARTMPPYLCHHQPWYHLNFTDEELRYYRRLDPSWAETHSASDALIGSPS